MTIKNKYVSRAHVSERKFRQIVRLFSVDLDATQTARLTGLSRNTINKYLGALRRRLVDYCESQSPLSGEVEVDESFFGARRVKGKRGRGAYGKTIVFGIFQRNGQAYTEIVPNCSKATLKAVIRGKVSLERYLRKLPPTVDMSKVELSGRMYRPGGFDEKVTIHRNADRRHPQGGRCRHVGQGDLP